MIWRIRDHGTFRALRGARRCGRPPLTVRAVRGPDPDDPPRVAYAIGRAVGNAVARNRLRRRLRAAVYEERDAMVPGAAYLVAASPGATTAGFSELRAALRRALVSAGDELA